MKLKNDSHTLPTQIREKVVRALALPVSKYTLRKAVEKHFGWNKIAEVLSKELA